MNSAIGMGVGPDRGLGAQLATRFAALGMHVFVAGRTQEKLDAVAGNIASMGGAATPVVTDATNEAAVIALFDRAAVSGRIEVAIYNAGNNTPGPIIDMSAEYFTQSWQICCCGEFLFGREAIRRMHGGGGALLFTGASASLRGRAGFGAFNSSKAALRTLAQAMAKESGKDGIHVGHVVVDGAIYGEKIKQRFPDYYEKAGEEKMISIEAIVDAFEYLYRQPKTGWSFEVDVRTAVESW